MTSTDIQPTYLKSFIPTIYMVCSWKWCDFKTKNLFQGSINCWSSTKKPVDGSPCLCFYWKISHMLLPPKKNAVVSMNSLRVRNILHQKKNGPSSQGLTWVVLSQISNLLQRKKWQKKLPWPWPYIHAKKQSWPLSSTASNKFKIHKSHSCDCFIVFQNLFQNLWRRSRHSCDFPLLIR